MVYLFFIFTQASPCRNQFNYVIYIIYLIVLINVLFFTKPNIWIDRRIKQKCIEEKKLIINFLHFPRLKFKFIRFIIRKIISCIFTMAAIMYLDGAVYFFFPAEINLILREETWLTSVIY